MSVNMGQVSAVTASSTRVCTIPPGGSSVVLWSPGTAYVGLSTAVTSANGAAVTTSPVSFRAFPGSKGNDLYVIAATATTLNWIVSTDS